MGELLSGFGDLVFTLVIGYIGAIEFLYVVRHLYHWSFNHDGADNENDADTLARLQDHMRNQLATAEAVEANAGKNAMQDGVTYENGFRIDANQADIDRLTEQLNNKSLNDAKRKELEKELAKHKKIEQQTRKELQEAEAAYARQQQEAQENERKLLEAEQQREREQKRREEEAKRKAEEEEQRKLEEEIRKVEAEQQRKREEEKRKVEEEEQKLREEEKRKTEEEQQRKREEEQLKAEEELRQRNEEAHKQKEAEENARKLLEAEQEREREELRHKQEAEAEDERERQRQAAEDAERQENENRILLAEREMEEAQRLAEESEENERKFLEIERKLEQEIFDTERKQELTDNERRLIESIKQRELAEEKDEASAQKEAELLQRILQAREQLGEESEEEQNQRLFELEKDHEMKQRRIDENARLFLEAENEMADIQERMEEVVSKREFAMNLESVPQTPVEEEPCIKKTILPLRDGGSPQPVAHSVKTQLAQSKDDSYSVSTKSLLFPGVSDDASSNEPISSQQSSFSTQPSEEITTGNESQYPQQERQEPDGEDNAPAQQYSDDYLRSLDGIKQRPLSREDGSGRRRAFKKRRSSGSSNSSFESRASREEELKMFTSLEEEEMQSPGQSDFTPIRYTSEPTLKVKGHHRRHKRSPAKDMRSGDESLRSSLERLGEETINPWGDVVPEHYKQTDFWKREKAVSIDEELELEKPTSSEEISYDTATNLPSASSFEEATPIQNQEAIINLKNQDNKVTKEDEAETKATTDEAARSDNNTNLQALTAAERKASPTRSSASPRLRRSPRIEEMNSYEERWIESSESVDTAPSSLVNTPTIVVDEPSDFGTWRDEHGLIMEGLSDFYDFTASVNPSRSRSASRNPSPANTAPSSPQPRNVAFVTKTESKEQIDVYDDTNQLDSNELTRDNIVKFMDTLNECGPPEANGDSTANDLAEAPENSLSNHLKYVIDDQSREKGANSLLPMVNILEDTAATASGVTENEDMNALVASLRSQRCRSRSRSKSPLPTAGNIQRSLENRRNKMIKHNEDILEKLIVTNMLPETVDPSDTTTSEVVDDECSTEKVTLSAETLHVESSSSSRATAQPRTRSRSPSPLPTAVNIERSIEHRRNKRIQDNDEYFEKLTEKMITAERNSQSPVMFRSPMISIEVTEPDSTTSPRGKEEDDCSREEMESLVQSLRVARSRSRSRTPMRMYAAENPISGFGPISIEITESESFTYDKMNNDGDASHREIDSLVQSLRVARSRTRSKSPMRLPTADNLSKSLDSRRSKLIDRNDEIQNMLEEKAKTPESPQLTVEYVYEFVETPEEANTSTIESRISRSLSPSRSVSFSTEATYVDKEKSRSRSPSRSLSPSSEYEPYDSNFHVMLNLEGSHNKTLLKNSEEHESTLADRQKRLDIEALETLKNASEEIELRTLSPQSSDPESRDLLRDLLATESCKMLRCSPTTPDYDRTISEEMRDVERIKQEMLHKGFKRSTYVGESMDLGSEYEPYRREAAEFQRSRSPTPSITENEAGEMTAKEKRRLQDLVLAEITGSHETRNTGAIPKAERVTSTDSELSMSREVEDTLRIKEEILSSGFQRSTYVGESIDASLNFEEMRCRNADFRRSASKSRSPLNETELQELAGIEAEVAKREMQDREQDEIEMSAMNFQNFSRHLNPNFFDSDRRASDSAIIQKPEIHIQFHDNEQDMEPEEYHHYRRFSLAQEQPMEEYPNDDYIFIQQVEVRTRSGSRTWTREDFYSQDIDDFLLNHSKETSEIALEVGISTNEEERTKESEFEVGEKEYSLSGKASPGEYEEEIAVDGDDGENVNRINDNQEGIDDDEDSNGSDDRRTVIEVEDEIDEDISDFNERGPAEESQHEQSECEEAEREMDRYAGREASDWAEVVDVEQIYTVENVNASQTLDPEGAVGGAGNSPYDSDAFAQIYDEAVRNRKQSGILREFDSILNEMSNSFIENSNKDMDEEYPQGSKTHKKPKNVEFNINFIESERKDTEMRYLGDATVSARQSTRLRSRYGYNPVLQTSTLADDIEVDLNYRPKREYNWRKNFKLDDDGNETLAHAENNLNGHDVEWDLDESNAETAAILDLRKHSLGGESITIFSRSPDKEIQVEDFAVDAVVTMENDNVQTMQDMEQEQAEKPKKRKTKKKTRKGSKANIEAELLNKDEDADESYVPAYSRRSSSIQMDTDSPKRKSRSRRSSRASLTNEDSLGLYSPRSSVGCAEPIADIMEEFSELKETTRIKKIKKRKKVKEVVMADVTESPKEDVAINEMEAEPITSAAMTPDSLTSNVLAVFSSQESVCVTPASVESETSAASKPASTNTTAATTPSTPVTATPVDTFDILKDANFYPLF